PPDPFPLPDNSGLSGGGNPPGGGSLGSSAETGGRIAPGDSGAVGALSLTLLAAAGLGWALVRRQRS
ncbi:MAG: hypothetical protein LBV00_12470, partial [Propionibacteriaceae bacterium]|nr:hypothetical protein [Propionibacteriaceae bacterium]